MNDTISVLLFDLGRVLMHIDFDAFPNGLGLYTQEERAPYIGPAGKLWRVYETGAVSTEEFLEAMAGIFRMKYSKEKILEAWNGIIVRDNEEIVPFVHRVQNKYRTAILSNTSESHWQKVMTVSKIVPAIPHRFTSFAIGAMKPEPAVYEHVARSLDVAPSEILFIDDLPENVDGAVRYGMKGIVFQNVRQMELEFDLFEKKHT